MSLPSSGPNGCVEESALGEWFRLGEEIGRGATGRVYKAENLVSGQTVAIKKIPLGPTAAQQQSNLQCLMGEIELLKSLNHQNIVQFLGSCRTRTHLYIMLEYMEKGSLSSIIKQGVKLSEELAAVYIAQVLQGLRYLHAQGVVHRDIKGANILTNKQGVVKLADFGVSSRLGELELHQGLQQHVAGSPYWMAPEVIEMDQSITAASDIWSVGCLVVEALTGAPPYFDLQPMSALFRIVADQHPPLPGAASPLLQSFLMQCFNKDPSQRPAAGQLLKHAWITERRQTLRRTWRGYAPIRNRLNSTTAEESVNTVVNQDLLERPPLSPAASPGPSLNPSPSSSFAQREADAQPSTRPSLNPSPSSSFAQREADAQPSTRPSLNPSPCSSFAQREGTQASPGSSPSPSPSGSLASRGAAAATAEAAARAVVAEAGDAYPAQDQASPARPLAGPWSVQPRAAAGPASPGAVVLPRVRADGPPAAAPPLPGTRDARPQGVAGPRSPGAVTARQSGRANGSVSLRLDPQRIISTEDTQPVVGGGSSGASSYKLKRSNTGEPGSKSPSPSPSQSGHPAPLSPAASPAAAAASPASAAAAGSGGLRQVKSERSVSRLDLTRSSTLSSAAPVAGDAAAVESPTPHEPGQRLSNDGSESTTSCSDLHPHSRVSLSKARSSTQHRLQGDPAGAAELVSEPMLQRRSLPVSTGQGSGGHHHRTRSRIRNPHAAVYDRLFKHADRNGDGRLTGVEAAPFFERSGLSRDVLFKVWELADNRKRGFLDNTGFYTAMDAIALAQMGFELHKENWDLVHSRDEGFPLPRMRGFHHDGTPDNSEPLDTPSAPGISTAQFMTAPAFAAPRGLADAAAALLGKALGQPKKTAQPLPFKVCTSINDGLREIYYQKIRSIEELFRFSQFYTPIHQADFDAKPCVLLLGQYSTGKTSFIRYLLGRDYPGAHVGPEPTTDRFVVVHQGIEDRRLAGDMLAVRKDLPYQGLGAFGTGFLSRLEGAQCHSPLLDEVMLVDTPGLLAGDKQRNDLSYDLLEVIRWFANHSDLILLFFDPDKLDISDELQQVIRAIRMHSERLVVVLNKASSVQPLELMRVHGALMWGLGRAFNCPEMVRVCVGSFSDEASTIKQRASNPLTRTVFEPDEEELLRLLYECPKRSCERKVNDLLQRLRACKVHLLLIDHLRKQLSTPMLVGLGPKKGMKKLLDDLHMQFIQVQRVHHLPIGDFPDLHHFSQVLSTYDLSAFPKVTPAMIRQLDEAIQFGIPSLLKHFDNPFEGV